MKTWGAFYKDIESLSVANLSDYIMDHCPYIHRIRTYPGICVETGVGIGYASIYLKSTGRWAICLDNDMTVLKKARETFQYFRQDIPIVCGDIFHLPFKKRAISLIYNEGVLEHFNPEEIRATLKETLSVSGEFIFSVPSKNYPWRELGDERHWNLKEWRKILKGFKIKDEFGYTYFGAINIRYRLIRLISFLLKRISLRRAESLEINYLLARVGFVIESETTPKVIYRHKGVKNNNKTLVIMPQSLGDVYRMTAIVDGLNKRYPNKKIDFMTKKRFSHILEANPYIEKVIPYPEDGENPYYAVEFDRLRERDKLIKEYEEIYTPYYGFQLSYEELMRNRDTGKNVVELFAEFCGLTRDEIGSPYLAEENFPIDCTNYIVIHSRTYDTTKNWDYFPHFVKKLIANGFTVCQIGSENDTLIKSCKDYRGLSFGKLGYLLRNARLFIGVDSFPAHLSAGVGTKTIVLYGGTDANFSKPYWGDVVTIEPDRAMFGCKNACHAKDCSKRRKCINGIRPKEVWLCQFYE